MISSLKTAMIAGVLAVGAVAMMTPLQAEPIGRNTYGIVYNASDCGEQSVRFYAVGGKDKGSLCGAWLTRTDMGIVRQANGRDHYWNMCEIDTVRMKQSISTSLPADFNPANYPHIDRDLINQYTRCGY